MNRLLDRSCGCPPLGHPRPPDVPAGLSRLAQRQWAGFPEYRAALLASIADHPALAGWRARGKGDLGVMLLEAWATVLDVVGFYDAHIAERSYLPTAPDAEAAARLTALLGHRRRPAMAARVQLAVSVDGADPLHLPPATAFRSEPFDDEPPQVFELAGPRTVWPERNRFELAPVREATFDGTLRFAARGAAGSDAVVVAWTPADAAAVRIVEVVPDTTADGEAHQRAVLDTTSGTLDGLAGAAFAELTLAVMRLRVGETPIPEGRQAAGSRDRVVLDGYYPQLQAGSRAALELGGVLHAVTLTSVERTTIVPAANTTAPPGLNADSTQLIEALLEGARPRVVATEVRYTPSATRSADDGLRLHAVPFTLPRPFRPAKTAIDLTDLQTAGALVPPVDLGDAPRGGSVIAVGAARRGASLPGELVSTPDGAGTFQPGPAATGFPPLHAPVELLGNLVEAVRGETIGEEVLGSGAAGRGSQSFVLRKKPLAWVEDASQPDGRRPELTVRVEGYAWQHVTSFFACGPADLVYTLRMERDGATRVTFGDGVRGARLPSGVDNVRCTYRFGAGAATPPPGAIEQIARPVRGLAAVRGPLAAVGGADAEAADELRDAAPQAALTLGRAVSLLDFEVLARGFSGVINAAAAWAWDERRQRAAVKLWTLAEGGDVSAALVPWLEGQAAPDVVIRSEPALPAAPTSLVATLRYAPGHDPASVRAAVEAALFDPETGLLAPRRQRIGATLFRSTVVHRAHAVPGVDHVESLLVDGLPMPVGIAPGQGRWFDLAALSTVG
jgi:hypothetical protein